MLRCDSCGYTTTNAQIRRCPTCRSESFSDDTSQEQSLEVSSTKKIDPRIIALVAILFILGLIIAVYQARPTSQAAPTTAQATAVPTSPLTTVTQPNAAPTTSVPATVQATPEPAGLVVTDNQEAPVQSEPQQPIGSGTTLRPMNIRKGPSQDYEIIGSLPSGTNFSFYVQQGDWVRTHPTQSEWINIEVATAPEPSPASQPSPVPGQASNTSHRGITLTFDGTWTNNPFTVNQNSGQCNSAIDAQVRVPLGYDRNLLIVRFMDPSNNVLKEEGILNNNNTSKSGLCAGAHYVLVGYYNGSNWVTIGQSPNIWISGTNARASLVMNGR